MEDRKQKTGQQIKEWVTMRRVKFEAARGGTKTKPEK